MTEPRLCKDCRWAKNLAAGAISGPFIYDWQCRHPSSLIPPDPPSPVTGEVRPARQLLCEHVRRIDKDYNTGHVYCGPEGKFWEPIGLYWEPVEVEFSGVIGFGEALTSDYIEPAPDNHRHLIPDTVTYDAEADVLFMGGDGIDTEAEEILPGVILLMDAHDFVTGIEITTASRLLKAIKPC